MIWTLKKEGRSETYIAARIGCSVSTISRELDRIKVYFAKPYHSWERGTNENRNGVVRKILPRGSTFDAIIDEERGRIDRMLNDRPLKCLNWRTPREAFTALLHRHLLAAA